MPVAHDITNLVKGLGLGRHPDRVADNSCNKCCPALPVENSENIPKLACLLLKKGYYPRIIRLN